MSTAREHLTAELHHKRSLARNAKKNLERLNEKIARLEEYIDRVDEDQSVPEALLQPWMPLVGERYYSVGLSLQPPSEPSTRSDNGAAGKTRRDSSTRLVVTRTPEVAKRYWQKLQMLLNLMQIHDAMYADTDWRPDANSGDCWFIQSNGMVVRSRVRSVLFSFPFRSQQDAEIALEELQRRGVWVFVLIPEIM